MTGGAGAPLPTPYAGRVLRWTDLEQIPPGFGPSVVTIGVFDGVHRGHRALLTQTVADARSLGTSAVTVTFDPNPLAVLRPESAPAVLMTLQRRLDLMAELGIDAALVVPFTAERAAQPPEEFVHEVLVGRLQARGVVVGENFRFGRRAAGDVAMLSRLGAQEGFTVTPIPLTGEGDTTFSSTHVREYVLAGAVERAAAALGRPFRVEGTVVRGEQRGRLIGYPTANLATPPGAAIPADGVYAGWLLWRGDRLPAAISIGTNPTFDGKARTVEAYVLDRDDLELYGERVELDFAERLRDTLRFGSVDELVEQMAKDCDTARDITGSDA